MYAHRVNSNESLLLRMKIRSPALPDDVAATWDYFLEKVPFWLWADHTAKDVGGVLVRNVIGERFCCDGYSLEPFRCVGFASIHVTCYQSEVVLSDSNTCQTYGNSRGWDFTVI